MVEFACSSKGRTSVFNRQHGFESRTRYLSLNFRDKSWIDRLFTESWADLAQLVEYKFCKLEVAGSRPAVGIFIFDKYLKYVII